jgi:hypothetical protein
MVSGENAKLRMLIESVLGVPVDADPEGALAEDPALPADEQAARVSANPTRITDSAGRE